MVSRGVLVLLICVQIFERRDCFSHRITIEVWKPAQWKTAKIHQNEHTPVYLLWNRRKTLTGSPDPTHANGTDKPSIVSSVFVVE